MYPEICTEPELVEVDDTEELYPLVCGSGVSLLSIVVTKESGTPTWTVNLYSRNIAPDTLPIVLVMPSVDGLMQITTAVPHRLVDGDTVTLGSVSPGGGDFRVVRVLDAHTVVINQSFIEVRSGDAVSPAGTLRLVMTTARKAHYLVKSLSASSNIARYDGTSGLTYRNQDAMDNTGQPRKIYAEFDTTGDYTVTFKMAAHDAY